MKECKKARKLLSRYLDKEIGDADAAFAREHLDICHTCNKEYQKLFKVKQLMLGKERKSLPVDYLVRRLREVVSQQYAEERPSLIAGMGDISRRLIPVPAAVIALALLFLVLSSGQQASEYSLEEHILSSAQTTTDTALRLILEAQN